VQELKEEMEKEQIGGVVIDKKKFWTNSNKLSNHRQM